MKIGTEIFNSLKGFGFLVSLYSEDGNGPIANPDLARYIYAKDKESQDSLMLRLPEDAAKEYAEVVVYKSEGMDDKLSKLLMTVKNIARTYGSTITIREFGKNIEPKDLAYLPKAKQEMEMTAVNEAAKYYDSLSPKAKEILCPIFKKAILDYNMQDFDQMERFVNNFSPFSFSKFNPRQKDEARELWMSVYDDLKGHSEIDEDVIPFKNRDLKWFSTSSGRIELQISFEDAESCAQSGDNEENTTELLKKSYIANQFSKLDPETIKNELKEFGSWNDEDLSDEYQNEIRLLWLACCDISDRTASGEDLTEAERFNSDIFAVDKDTNKLIKAFPRGSDREAHSMAMRNPNIKLMDRDSYRSGHRIAEEELTEATKYVKSGTSRSSYHVNPKAKNARVIIRHSKKVIDEGKPGARSRNVKSLYVESLNGERRLIETKSLMCARAIANHVNHGGSLFDDTANKILCLSEDMKKIRNLKKKYPISEDADNCKMHTSFNSILEGLSDFMKCLNTRQISTLSEALNLSEPNVSFAKTFYAEKLGEGFDSDSLARGSVLYTRTRKFLPR